MNILSITIIIFCILEFLNVIILYFRPDLKLGNGVAVFNSWQGAKENEKMNLFVHYMAYWVAGVKLIFIFLLLVIAIFGNEITKIFAVISMILSISTYFWKLSPIIKKLDTMGQITPSGYSKTLNKMIIGFMTMFIISLAIYFMN